MATAADLEAAIARLDAKKQRLRETFDRLVACSPVPIAFRWEDLDAHLSSLQSSFIADFRQLEFQASVPADGPTTVADRSVRHRVERLEEDPESRVRRRRGVRMEDQESSADEREEATHAPLDQEQEREEREVGPSFNAPSVREGEEGENENAFPLEASPRQGDEEIRMVEDEESVNPSAEQQGNEDELDEAKRPRPGATAVGGGESALVQAIVAGCANMDASTLVDMLCLDGRSRFRARRAFLPALLGAADPHGLVIRAVRGFLATAKPKTDRSWGNCVALLDCVPHLTGTATPPVGTLEQAERLARDWKEMVAKPGAGSCRDMGRLAGWGLFTFLVSYSVVLEFDADEIIRLFGNLPHNKTINCIELCKRLGLIEKMIDSVSHLIEDGRPHDAVRLAHALDLTHKYSPICIMYDFLEKAKKTAQEILSKESDSLEPLNQAMAKKMNALILSWTAVDECNIDSNHRDSIKAEITQLLHIYADKQQSLAGVSACSSASHQLHKTQPEQQQQQQQGCGWQNFMARQRNNNRKRNLRMKRQRNQQEKQQQKYNKRPRFSPYSGIRGVPFADRISPRRDFGPCDHSRPRPASIPPPKPE